jgi:flavin reductase (DIM6/NTAB) family NADH-FMN oxidoreductase RutF
MAGKHRLRKTRNERRTLGATCAAAIGIVAVLVMGFAGPVGTEPPVVQQVAAPSQQAADLIARTQLAAVQAWREKVDAIPTMGSKSPADGADSDREARTASRETSCK